MHDSSVQANIIYDELQALKSIPSRLSDSELQIARENLETIPQKNVRIGMQYLLLTEHLIREFKKSISNLLTLSKDTNKKLRICQNKSQNHEQHLLREQSCAQKCFEWMLIICGLVFVIIETIDLIRVDIASATEKKIYSWVRLAFGIIIFLIGLVKRYCRVQRYKAINYQSVSQG